MLIVSEYKLKPFASQDEGKALMEQFGQVGNVPGMIAHYVNADGTGGFVVSENDSAAELHRNAIAYSQWLSIKATVVVSLDEGVANIFDELGIG